MPISSDDLVKLQTKVATLVSDKKVADDATSISNDAHAGLQKAQADVAQADSAEAAADGQVNVDLNDLQTFIDGLAAPNPS